MRIHLVGAGFEHEPWRYEADVYEALMNEGHEVAFTDHRQAGSAWHERLAQPADLLLVMKGEWIPPRAIASAPCPKVLWYPDDLIHSGHGFEQVRYNGAAFDVVYGISKHDLGVYRVVGCKDVRWLPLACNPQKHWPQEIRLPADPTWFTVPMEASGISLRWRDPLLPSLYDVLFLGSLNPKTHPHRVGFLYSVDPHVQVSKMDNVYGDAMVWNFHQAKIVLNIAVGPGNMNHRIFEALGCGCFLLTEECEGLEEILQDGVHLVTYRPGDAIDAGRKARYYLERPEERRAIAQRGYEEVKAKHTVEHRVRQIMCDLFGRQDMEGES